MAKIVKMCDMTGSIAARVFVSLNAGKVILIPKDELNCREYLVTDTEPKDLIFPDGWYYGKGCLRNKHNSTTGIYDEIYLQTSNGKLWGDIAKYCTR